MIHLAHEPIGGGGCGDGGARAAGRDSTLARIEVRSSLARPVAGGTGDELQRSSTASRRRAAHRRVLGERVRARRPGGTRRWREVGPAERATACEGWHGGSDVVENEHDPPASALASVTQAAGTGLLALFPSPVQSGTQSHRTRLEIDPPVLRAQPTFLRTRSTHRCRRGTVPEMGRPQRYPSQIMRNYLRRYV